MSSKYRFANQLDKFNHGLKTCTSYWAAALLVRIYDHIIPSDKNVFGRPACLNLHMHRYFYEKWVSEVTIIGRILWDLPRERDLVISINIGSQDAGAGIIAYIDLSMQPPAPVD